MASHIIDHYSIEYKFEVLYWLFKLLYRMSNLTIELWKQVYYR